MAVRLAWRKSGRCDSGTCVEVAVEGRSVRLRDGADPDGPQVTCGPTEWAAFVAELRRTDGWRSG